MAFRSQPAGLTADDLFYQQVMGTQFVYDETGAVVELWQLEHRLVVDCVKTSGRERGPWLRFRRLSMKTGLELI